MSISIGDVVHLRGGSLPLTVVEIKEEQARCCWMGYLYDTYPIAALVRVVCQDQLGSREYR